MAKVEIYTKPTCPYCLRAKATLLAKGIRFEEIDIVARPDRRQEMTARAGGRTTVPQIFIDGKAVGGCDDLHELDRQGELDSLLAAVS
ncbi:glutaredoxin 3 [uncultured Gammaproteobacteria bacterium]